MTKKLLITLFAALMALPAFSAEPKIMPSPADGKMHTFSTNDTDFLMDGKPVKIISGEIHYPRVPREHWRDRLKKIKAMGMNTICTYLFWNMHEKKPGQWDFSGNLDIAEFCRIAQQEGLWVMVRPGPYVCAEWEMGGFPGWLLKDPDTVVRSMDPRFIKPAQAYLEQVCKQLAPLQISKGGPVIMAQVENEYGSFGDDKEFLKAHFDVIKKYLPDVLPFTSDNPSDRQITNGSFPGALPALNFGGGSAENHFAVLKKHYPNVPMINGEFWVGWFDFWGNPKNVRDVQKHNENFKWMLDNNVSPNFYMVHGGTDFGFMNGANWTNAYAPDVTNYDYGSPIEESGRINERYHIFRKTLQDYYGDAYTLPEPPPQPEFMTIPAIEFKETAGMFDNLPEPVIREKAINMEALDQTLGFIMYRTKVTGPLKGKFVAEKLQDRAHIYVNGKRSYLIDRRYAQNSCDVDIPEGEHTLDIFVENLGRINFGGYIRDERKGIRGSVTIDGKEITGFSIYTLPCETLDNLKFSTEAPATEQPVFHRSTFKLDEVKDTYLDMRDGWKKGNVWVNGHNLGRFWFIGSQQALYCPMGFLKKGDNEIVVLDLEGGMGTVKGVTDAIYEVNPDPHKAAVAALHTHGTAVYPAENQIVKKGTFNNSNNWENIRFDAPITTRYIAIESLSSYDKENKEASITELIFMDDKNAPLNREDWSIVYADSQEVTGENAPAGFVMDNQPTTHWSTQWKTSKPKHPHIIVLDLGKEQNISGFDYLPRQDTERGRIKDYVIYASEKPFSSTKP